ncbi:MAG: type II toxin-antitoxin system VapC family toxin, partial [Tannerella sp.]|nr:type II toxin-antitoxin system VapC family toxin [Tannerella sp.]
GDSQLSEPAKQAILCAENKKYVSMASIGEVAIKISLHKLSFNGNITGFLKLIDDNGFDLLPIDKEHVIELERLPCFHRDPFDRVLIAAAISEKMSMITIDKNIRLYPLDYIW